MRNRVIGMALAATLSVALIGSTASADVRTVKDKRGESRALDIASVKLNNGKVRLVSTVRITKRSMRPRGGIVTAVKYRKPRVSFHLMMQWAPKFNRPKITVQLIPHRGAFAVVTKRCDVRATRRGNMFRIGVDQERCFRKSAGRVRFLTGAFPKHGDLDAAPSGFSKPIRRG